jgi:hypothetical protein
MDAVALIRCLSWEANGELHPQDRDAVVSRLLGADVGSGVELSRLLSCTELVTPS